MQIFSIWLDKNFISYRKANCKKTARFYAATTMLANHLNQPILISLVYNLVHKRMFYILMNLRMLQHSNVRWNIRMYILCNKMMYFGDFVVLVLHKQLIYIYHLIKMNALWFLNKKCVLRMHTVASLACKCMY